MWTVDNFMTCITRGEGGSNRPQNLHAYTEGHLLLKYPLSPISLKAVGLIAENGKKNGQKSSLKSWCACESGVWSSFIYMLLFSYAGNRNTTTNSKFFFLTERRLLLLLCFTQQLRETQSGLLSYSFNYGFTVLVSVIIPKPQGNIVTITPWSWQVRFRKLEQMSIIKCSTDVSFNLSVFSTNFYVC